MIETNTHLQPAIHAEKRNRGGDWDFLFSLNYSMYGTSQKGIVMGIIVSELRRRLKSKDGGGPGRRDEAVFLKNGQQVPEDIGNVSAPKPYYTGQVAYIGKRYCTLLRYQPVTEKISNNFTIAPTQYPPENINLDVKTTITYFNHVKYCQSYLNLYLCLCIFYNYAVHLIVLV